MVSVGLRLWRCKVRTTLIRTARMTLLPQNYGQPNLTRCKVILEWHVIVIEKREDVLRVLAKTLRQPPGVAVDRLLRREVRQDTSRFLPCLRLS